jgi:pyridinium-3,5-bisthiocarboxylic acid mononucleotide nickel chelatase
VKCEHGLMPVPAPATARILQGVPLAATTAKGELCTPTGAAILKAVVSEFVTTPSMTIERIGYGAGTKDLMDQPNVVRLLIGKSTSTNSQTVTLLETNLDDCTGEVLGYTMDRLFEAGAFDVSFTPIQMKKNRPGVMISVIVPHDKSTACEAILFRETGTFGIRKQSIERVTLDREAIRIETKFGPVRAKRGSRDGHHIITPEFDDCARIAKERGMAIREVYRDVSQ